MPKQSLFFQVQMEESSAQICILCRYPICNSNCNGGNHTKRECDILVQIQSQIKMGNGSDEIDFGCNTVYEIVLPIRLLLLKHDNPDGYQAVDKLMGHTNDR